MAGENSKKIITEFDLDVLREVANIGAGNAATAFSEMMGMPIDLKVPNCTMIGFNEIAERLGGPENVILCMIIKISGDIEGYILVTQSMDDAKRAMEILFAKDVTDEDRDPASFENMREVGSILSETYLSAIAELAHLTISAEVPELMIDMANAIMNIPISMYGKFGDSVLFMNTEFGGETKGINGEFFMIPTMESLEILEKALLKNI